MASEVVNKSIDGDKVTLIFQLENEEVCILLTMSIVFSTRAPELIKYMLLP